MRSMKFSKKRNRKEKSLKAAEHLSAEQTENEKIANSPQRREEKIIFSSNSSQTDL